MELITVKSMELRVMSNKTKIILVSIVGVIVVFGIGALAGNLMHSNSNAGAKSTTSVSAKKSSKASSSSIKQYVEGKDYSIEHYEANGTSQSIINNALKQSKIDPFYDKNLSSYMKDLVSIDAYYRNNGNEVVFQATHTDGKHEDVYYNIDTKEVKSGTGENSTLSDQINYGELKLVWRFINKQLS